MEWKSFQIWVWIGLLGLGPLMGQPKPALNHIGLQNLAADIVYLDSLADFHIFFFLSPECPLCENYSKAIRDLRTAFPQENIAFYGVFPGTFYTPGEITRYLAHYKVPVSVLWDKNYTLTEHFGAKVTPEVILADACGAVLYQGKIDNWIMGLGKKRTNTSRHYLSEALQSAIRAEPILVSKTTAIGCLIE